MFPIEKIAAALDRSTMTVKTALSELSSYMESTGKSYQNPLSALLRQENRHTIIATNELAV